MVHRLGSKCKSHFHCVAHTGDDSVFEQSTSNENGDQQRKDKHGTNKDESHANKIADKLRRSLKYHFMNPYQKWKANGHFPWKLVLQLIKIVFVTAQVCYVFFIWF